MGDEMTESGKADVLVLDIRVSGEDSAWLDGLTLDNAHETDVADRVVVVDNARSLVGNHARYQRLSGLGQVRAIICVAVGRMGVDDGVLALRQSAALGPVGVTLWVGDPHGSEWAGGSGRPRPVSAATEPALRDLLAAVTAKEVFDEVFERVREVPHQVVCPGLEVLYPAVGPAELRSLRLNALLGLTKSDPVASQLPLTPHARPDAGSARTTLLPGSPLAQSRTAVWQHLGKATRAMSSLASPGGLFGGSRVAGRAAVRPVSELGEVLDHHARLAGSVSDLLDRQGVTGTGGANLAELGVPMPDEADQPALAAELRDLVATELRNGRSLPDLAVELRKLANRQAPQGGGATTRRLAELSGTAVPAGLRTPGSAALWPWPMATVLPVVSATCAGATWLHTVGIAVGLISALWVGLTALLVSRRPVTDSGSTRTSMLTMAAVVLSSAAGMAVGIALPPAPVIPAAGLAVAVAGAVLLAIGTVVLAWRHAVGGWVRLFALDRVGSTEDELEALLDKAIRDQTGAFTHRSALADAALLLASGIFDVSAVFADTAKLAGARPEPDKRVPGGASAELFKVLHRDLVSLAVQALDPYLADIRTHAELAVDADRVTHQTTAALTEYHAYLDSHSIHSQPSMVDDAEPRRELSVALWRRSDAGRRILTSDGRGSLTQLCRAGDLRLLNRTWSAVAVLRFGPAHVQRALLDSTDSEIVLIDADMVGVLRLVPLAAGRVLHIQPTHADAAHETGWPQ
jgi:hypothetical protein